MAFDTDPSADIYAMLDKADLTPSNVLGARQSTSKTIEEIRRSIVTQFCDYIKAHQGSKELDNGTQGQ